ncbi:MAG: hypothetical protein HY532_07275 [Chloroflexi bacterium]|nr:hypothetical protein [Chloroflexota bacterium]
MAQGTGPLITPGQKEPTSNTTSQAEEVETGNDRWSTVLGFLFIGLIAGAIFFANWDAPTQLKFLSVIGVTMAAAGAGLIALFLVYRRKIPAVAWTGNFVALMLAIFLVSIFPVVLFGAVDRILALKLGAILVLSLIPGWLYLQFITAKGKTLREEYILNLYRLHVDDYGHLPKPPTDSLFYKLWTTHRQRNRSGSAPAVGDESDNLYLRKFDGLYGHIAENSSSSAIRFQAENLLPIFVTTVLLAVGWTVVFQPEVTFGLSFIPGVVTLDSRPVLPTDAMRFGFMGAYFFVLQMLARRYFQDDLKTSAYINATVRIIAVMILVPAVHLLWPWSDDELNTTAFVIGVFPQVGLQALQTLATLPLQKLMPNIKKEYPLSDIDGLNVWYESRLLEEGIEDMQNLATANIVEVILRTRVPVDRLVDWIDQAHLYLRVPKESPDGRADLRRLGIRSATDLEDVFGSDQKRRQLPGLLDKLGQEKLQAILATLESEPNLHHVRRWKEYTKELKRQHPETAVQDSL